MRKENTAHFDLVKLQNKRIIRNLLRQESPLSIAKTAEMTGLSYPTASALLKELTESGEVVISTEMETGGGRPGICYELNGTYQHALVLYFDDWTIRGKVQDAYGKNVKECQEMMADSGVETADIISYVRNIKEEFPSLSAVSIGIPGAVFETEITYLPKFPRLTGKSLAEELRQELEVEVFIENDINAMALSEAGEWENFAHIVYVEEDSCIGVGIVLNGEIVKGCHGYAGELEYLCADMTNQIDTFATSILALTCVLNLPDILISGNCCTGETVREIREALEKTLPQERIPEIHVVKDTKGKYEQGLLKRVLLAWSESIG